MAVSTGFRLSLGLHLNTNRSRETSLVAAERGALAVVLPAITAVRRLTTHARNKVVIDCAGADRANHVLNQGSSFSVRVNFPKLPCEVLALVLGVVQVLYLRLHLKPEFSCISC